MSNVFAGVLVPITMSAAADLARQVVPALKLNSEPVTDRITAFISEAARIDGSDVTKVADFAAAISRQAPALFIVYDDRTSTRISARYDGGMLVRTFGSNDERFVPLRPNGEPAEGPALSESQLDLEVEYELVVNASELGLRYLGGDLDWRELLA